MKPIQIIAVVNLILIMVLFTIVCLAQDTLRKFQHEHAPRGIYMDGFPKYDTISVERYWVIPVGIDTVQVYIFKIKDQVIPTFELIHGYAVFTNDTAVYLYSDKKTVIKEQILYTQPIKLK